MIEQRVYRAHVHFDHRGANVFCHYGKLSPCGEWVEAGDTRWRRTAEWFSNEAEAKASMYSQLISQAATIVSQAEALRAEATPAMEATA